MTRKDIDLKLAESHLLGYYHRLTSRDVETENERQVYISRKTYAEWFHGVTDPPHHVARWHSPRWFRKAICGRLIDRRLVGNHTFRQGIDLTPCPDCHNLRPF